MNTNVGGQNFQAIARPVGEIFDISGTVSGDVQGNVEISLQGATNDQQFTDLNGHYSFTDIPAGTYALVPTLEGYTFEPPFRILTLTNA